MTDANSTRPAARDGLSAAEDDAGATPAAPRPAPGDGDAPETPGERRLIDLLIIGIILFIFGAAFWLGDALLDARRADECMASGRRNCAPIEVPAPPPR